MASGSRGGMRLERLKRSGPGRGPVKWTHQQAQGPLFWALLEHISSPRAVTSTHISWSSLPPVDAGGRAAAPPRTGTRTHRLEAKQRPAAPRAPRCALGGATPDARRPGPLSAPSGLRPRLSPARVPPRTAHAALPASGQRPTTRGRRRRASSSWTEGGGGGDGDGGGGA